jgi:hypothetical protein
MATNDFIGFASSGNANVMSQADYAAAHEQFIGVQPGMASSALANKVWRQGANMAAVIGELIKNHGIDALDNGDLATLYNALLLATASTTLAGLMSAADKARLDSVILTDATQSAAGYMSASDKVKLDGLISSLATPTAAGYMSAEDKTNLDKLLVYDTASSAATPDYTNVANGASFEYRTFGAITLLSGYGKLLSATPGFSGVRVVSGLPVPAWVVQGNAYVYLDSSTYYGAWFSIDEWGNGYITTRAISVPADLTFNVFFMYPRAL